MATILLRELCNALADLRARPGWAFLVVLVLTCGLSSLLFSLTLINGLLIKPLPYTNAEEIYVAGLRQGDDPDIDSLPLRDALELKRRFGDSVESAIWSGGTLNLRDGERIERFDGGFAGTGLFDLLGVTPLIGTGFSEADMVRGAPLRVLLTEPVWARHFQRDPSVIGRVVRVNGASAEIIGVLPLQGTFPFNTGLWIQLQNAGTVVTQVEMLVRIKPAQKAAALSAMRDWHQTLKATNKEYEQTQPDTWPLSTYAIGSKTSAALWVMLAATFLVLLTACGNAANLLLSRHLARRGELAVRAALGASRLRLTLHLLMPALVLSVAAAALAWPLAKIGLEWALQALNTDGNDGLGAWLNFEIDPKLGLMMLLIALLTGLLSGLWPALRLSDAVNGALRDGGRGLIGAGLSRAGGWLVALEIALSAALLVGALAMVQSVRELFAHDLGIRTENVLTARIGLLGERFAEAPARLAYWQQLTARAAAEPGVQAATLTSSVPGNSADQPTLLPAAANPTERAARVRTGSVDDGFLRALGATLLQGRMFDSRDNPASPRVAVVDRTFVETYARAGSVLGQRFRLSPGEADERVVTVIGVIERLTLDDVDDAVRPSMLFPISQETVAFATLALKLHGDPAAFKPTLARLILEVDADTPAYWVRSYAELLDAANASQQVLLAIYASFGLLALLMAAGGLYGVVSASVAQRSAEIGVRRALGASAGAVLWGVMRRIGLQVVAGLLVGLGLGIPWAMLMLGTSGGENTLGKSLDPSIWIVVALLLATVAAVAALLPARRALKVEPMASLRGS